MAAVKTKLGRIPCDCCGNSVVLKENEAGTLTVACDECDVSAFAKKGTAAANRWRGMLPKAPADKAPESLPKAPAAPAPAPAPEPPQPAPKPKAEPFDPLGHFRSKQA